MSSVFLSPKPNVLHIFLMRANVACEYYEDINYA